MTDYKWNVVQMEHNVADGGVVTVHWDCVATDGDYSARVYGSVGFTPDPEAEGFIPYADLTEADVLGWLWGSMDKDETEANLAKQIDAQKNPVTVAGTPWG